MLSLRRAIIGTLEVPRYTYVVVLSRALITTSLCIRNDDVMRPGQLHLALPMEKSALQNNTHTHTQTDKHDDYRMRRGSAHRGIFMHF